MQSKVFPSGVFALAMIGFGALVGAFVPNSASAVQAAWDKVQVPQCGYCQSGQVMAATALLTSTPNPTDAQIDEAMSGNICRCGTYGRVRAAIKDASKSLGGKA